MDPKKEDHLYLDLHCASFLTEDIPFLTLKIRKEILTVCQFFLEAIPKATLLLTGSLSVGEGKISRCNGRISILSDYDIAVVMPSIHHTLPSFVKKKFSVFRRNLSLSTRLEVSLIWKFLLEHRLTTTAGKIIAGRKDLGPVLERLRPPRPGNSLAMAYLYLVKTLLNPGGNPNLLSKALLRGAQSFLLHQYRFSHRSEWCRISSLKFCREQIVQAKGILDGEGLQTIQTAAGHLLGEETPQWEGKHLVLTGRLLAALEPIVFPAPGWQEFLKHLCWLRRKRVFHLPLFHGTGVCIRGLRHMAEAWDGSVTQREEGLRQSLPLAAALSAPLLGKPEQDVRSAYGKLVDLFEDYLSYYPNRITVAPDPP